MFVSWSPVGGTVLKDHGTLRNWSLAGGSGPLGASAYSLLPDCGCNVTVCAPTALLSYLPCCVTHCTTS